MHTRIMRSTRLAIAALTATAMALCFNVGVAHSVDAFVGPDTLAAVQARGKVLCSTAGHLSAARSLDQPGAISGFDRDFCRAFAAATLGDPKALEFVLLVPKNRFEALSEGAVDVLVRSTTWNYERDTTMGLHFAAVNFYDGQGFVAPVKLGVKRLRDLREHGQTAVACVEKGTTSQENVANYIHDHDLPVTMMEFNAFEELRYAFITGRCDLYTSDRSFLAEFRNAEMPVPDDYLLLEDVISKEPLGVAVRDDDIQWFAIMRWVVFATIQAEELGITSANVDALLKTGTRVQKHFLGAGEPGFGKGLGLGDDWAYQVIKAVGNYGEIFARNLGPDTPYNLDRGANALWTRGGLMYAPPF